MIPRASKKRLSDLTDLPDVSSGVMLFFQPLKVFLVQKEQVAGYTEEQEICRNTHGVRQPFTAQQLQIKAEGERAWIWHKLHCLPDLILKVDDKVRIQKLSFRVMQRTDYREYGYLEYDLVQDYSAE